MDHSATATLPTAPTGRAAIRAGRALSGLAIAFFILDAAMKLPPLQPVTDTMTALGWPTDVAGIRMLGVLMLASVALYAYRPTALLGAILMTGYLGGAVATHVRIGSPLFTHTLFGIYVGMTAWAGLWLRDARLRLLLPIRRGA